MYIFFVVFSSIFFCWFPICFSTFLVYQTAKLIMLVNISISLVTVAAYLSSAPFSTCQFGSEWVSLPRYTLSWVQTLRLRERTVFILLIFLLTWWSDYGPCWDGCSYFLFMISWALARFWVFLHIFLVIILSLLVFHLSMWLIDSQFNVWVDWVVDH